MPRQKPKALSTDAAFAGGPARSSCEVPAAWRWGRSQGAGSSGMWESIDRGAAREEERKTCQRRKSSRSTFPSRWCGRRTGGLRPTRVPREWTTKTLDEFEEDLKNNLFKIWNRMSSGSYFPPPVRAVELPKQHGGGVRLLGVPTVADRVAQTVVAMHLGERAEPRFHPDSYGYRPKKADMGCGGGMPSAVLEEGLGHRSRCRKVLRRGTVGPRRQGGGGCQRQPPGCCSM